VGPYGVGVGFGVVFAVVFAVVFGVGFGVAFGVGFGVGFLVGVGVGVAVGAAVTGWTLSVGTVVLPQPASPVPSARATHVAANRRLCSLPMTVPPG
jgi:hypothetical protein